MKPIHYKPGDQVMIKNTTMGGKPFNEGEAQLTQFVSKEQYPPYSEYWKVRFLTELGSEYVRRIDPPEKGDANAEHRG